MACFKQLELENYEMEKRLHQLKASMKTEKEERKRMTGHRWKSTEAGAADALKFRVQANANFINNSTTLKLKVLKDFKTVPSNISDKVHTNSTTNKTSKRQSHLCLRDRFSQCHICEENKNANRKQNVIDCRIEPLCNSCQPSYRERRPGKSFHYQRIKLQEEPQNKKSSNLLNGCFDEEESSRSFQEALKSWRTERKNTQSLQTEIRPSNQVVDHKVVVNTSTNTRNVSPNVPLAINFSEKSSLLYHERLLLFNRYMIDSPSSPAEENSSETPSQVLLNSVNSETNRTATNDDEKENFLLDKEPLFYSPLIDLDLYIKSVAQRKSIDDYTENEQSIDLPYSKTSCESEQFRLVEVLPNENESSEIKESESSNLCVIFPDEPNNMQTQRRNPSDFSIIGLRPPTITSQDFGGSNSARQRTNILPLPPLSPRVISPRSNLSRPMTELSSLFTENSAMKKKNSLLPLHSPKANGPRTLVPPPEKPPWSFKRGTIPPLNANKSFLSVKSPSSSRSPSPLFRRSPLPRSPLLGYRSQRESFVNRLSVASNSNGSSSEAKEETKTESTVPNEAAEESPTSSASSKINEVSPQIAINTNGSSMDFLEGVVIKDPIVPKLRAFSSMEKMLMPSGFMGPTLWNPDESIVSEILAKSEVNCMDFGIKDYLNSTDSILDLDSLDISGDYNNGLDILPPDVVCCGGDLTNPEEELGLPSPDRTESPILIMCDGKAPADEELLDVKKIQEDIITRTRLCTVTKRLVRLSSIDLEQMDQKQVDAALSIEEDNGQGSGLSSPISETENGNPAENEK